MPTDHPMPATDTMHYKDGTPVEMGDRVKLGTATGVVVFIIDTGDFSTAYPRSSWAYLERGVMIDFDQYGLVHYTTPEEDIVFLSRASAGENA